MQKLIKMSLKRIGVVWLGLRVGSAVCVSDRVFYYASVESERSVEQCLRKFERLDFTKGKGLKKLKSVVNNFQMGLKFVRNTRR